MHTFWQKNGKEMNIDMDQLTSLVRVRISAKDAHYGGNLVDGAYMLHLFGDVATELCIKTKGDEGLLLRYDEIEFLAPVYAGDFVEAYGKIVKQGNTSMVIELTAKKIAAARPDIGPSAADFLDNPVLVCKAKGIAVVPKEKTRK
jgi:3-aminobutyryl-CoA ammonia-lyase